MVSASAVVAHRFKGYVQSNLVSELEAICHRLCRTIDSNWNALDIMILDSGLMCSRRHMYYSERYGLGFGARETCSVLLFGRPA